MEDAKGQQACNKAKQETRRRPVIVPFPNSNAAGQVLYRTNNQYTGYQTGLEGDGKCMYAPFTSEIDWEFAKSTKLRGPGSTSVSELLQINEVRTTHQIRAFTP